MSAHRPLSVEHLNPSVLKVQYAVRGELAIKAEEYRNKLQEADHGLPFDRIISSNIGNPQQKGLDQPPITFTRQVKKTNPALNRTELMGAIGRGVDGMASIG